MVGGAYALAETAVVKRGSRGVEVRSADGVEEFPPLDAAVVDTTGAGDALAAGFLVGGIELGLEAAARCVGQLGAVPVTEVLRIAPEVPQALHDGGPVVALETTLVAHGFPPGVGVEVGRAAEAAVRSEGAVPATVGVLDGQVVVGLDPDELERFGEAGGDARKAGPRDLGRLRGEGAARRDDGRRHARGCAPAGIRFMGTGGIGGVHRGFAERPDVSADLAELARTPALVVSSGIKSLLDVPATAELLETLGVPVLGYRTTSCRSSTAPAAARRSRPASTRRRRRPASAAAHWELGGAALLLARDPDDGVTTSSR